MLLSSLFFNCFGVSMVNELWMQIKLSWWSLIHFKRFWERSVLLLLMLQIDLSVHITFYMTQHLMTHNEKDYILGISLFDCWIICEIQIEMWIYMEFFFWKITYFYIYIWINLCFTSYAYSATNPWINPLIEIVVGQIEGNWSWQFRIMGGNNNE